MKVIYKQCLLAIAALLIAIPGAFAQDYPNKTVKVILGYVPGGGVDSMIRMLCQKLTQITGQSFIVENKPGAGGTLAATYVAKSRPDGYTLLMGDSSQLFVAPHMYKGLQYDPIKDFIPVGLVTTTGLVLVANARTGIKTLTDLIREAKANPGKLRYGSSGIGTPHHLSVEMFKADAGIDIEHIPYKGSGQSITAVLSGEVPLLITSMTAAESHARDGKLNLIAISSAVRMPSYPNIPSFADAIKGYDFPAENGLLAPAGLPPEVLAKLSKALKQAVESPDFVEKYNKTPGTTITWTSPEGYVEYLRRGAKKYERAMKLINLQTE
jgi:tripartite-type tricarboxylate transporter receptor subunit TctC